jgi:hypothetical protein
MGILEMKQVLQIFKMQFGLFGVEQQSIALGVLEELLE